jgi:hypothetical protein
MNNSNIILKKFDFDKILNFLFVNNETMIFKYINIYLEHDSDGNKYYICEKDKNCWFYDYYRTHSNKNYIIIKKIRFKKIHYNNENNEQYKIRFNILRLITSNFLNELVLQWDIYIEYVYHLCLSPKKDYLKNIKDKLLDIKFLFV